MISLSNVTKTYGKATVLGPVTLDIPAGGITALVGPNGAGKSTLLTIVGRLTDASTGTVTVGGHDVTKAKSRDLAKVVSILRQENHFVTRLTVRELVGFGRFPHSQGRLTPDDKQHIDRAIEFLDLTTLEHRYLDQLSGGQRQRAYVAMVLAQDTDYILLDEPLNNLDMKHAVAMMGQLRRAADELGKTFVIVIHDINFAAAYADNIIALTDGQLAHSGSPKDLMTTETLEHVFGTPIEVRHDGDYPLAVYYR
ncbi:MULTISPECIES: ABC transporter ATP-binding protein [unclassified Pseudoclavibacter]|uniref:iron ABC transporter ATP-binding protein n=1 Tax=unclassified Pseudoclavibacter TaxID=2615177 RepID=UPI001BA4885E|nr:ATP-binding cassette domain-containing protein [Pseudoclavibacter sp. Marseille-Q4354]MBS3178223.1 ATP-binding cassette domain-containing protein [Pseudoclavibacter sp. Marseille-Q4354]